MGNVNSCCEVEDDLTHSPLKPKTPPQTKKFKSNSNTHYSQSSSFYTPVQTGNTFGDAKLLENVSSRRGTNEEDFSTPGWKHMNASQKSHDQIKDVVGVPEEEYDDEAKKQLPVFGDGLNKNPEPIKNDIRSSNLSSMALSFRDSDRNDVSLLDEHVERELRTHINKGENKVSQNGQHKVSGTDLDIDRPVEDPPSFLDTIRDDDALHQNILKVSNEGIAKVIERNNEDYSSEYEKIYEEMSAEHKMRIYYNTYTTQESNTIIRIRCEWLVPTTPKQFIQFKNNNDERWKADDGSLERLKPITVMNMTEDQGFSIYYAAYKKSGAIGTRDIVYVKEYRKISEDTWADSSQSVEYPGFPPTTDHLRCEILYKGHLAKLVSTHEDATPVSLVKMCSEIDFKEYLSTYEAKIYALETVKDFIKRSTNNLKSINT